MKTIAAAVIALILAVGLGYWRGYASQSDTVAELKQQMKTANAAAEIELTKANAQVQERQKMLDAVPAQMETMKGERDNAHMENEALRSDLASARKRLSVTIASGSCHRAEQDQSAGSSAVGDSAPVTAELDPAVAARLVELTDTGDQAIRRLNACIAQYQAVQEASK